MRNLQLVVYGGLRTVMRLRLQSLYALRIMSVLLAGNTASPIPCFAPAQHK